MADTTNSCIWALKDFRRELLSVFADLVCVKSGRIGFILTDGRAQAFNGLLVEKDSGWRIEVSFGAVQAANLFQACLHGQRR